MEWISLLSIFVTAIATCVIAYFSRESTRLAGEIKKHEETYRARLEEQARQHQSELRDLYQAMTVATLMGGSSNTGVVKELIKTFGEHYSGKIEIFKS